VNTVMTIWEDSWLVVWLVGRSHGHFTRIIWRYLEIISAVSFRQKAEYEIKENDKSNYLLRYVNTPPLQPQSRSPL
jgi:hypothetical protein